MPDKRWSYEGGSPALREYRGHGTGEGAHRQADRQADTAVLEVPVRPRARRFAPYPATDFGDRDAMAATALAALQAPMQAPSVLDVDATSLRTRSRARREAPAEPQWTPPVLPVEEPAPALPDSGAIELADLDRRPRSRPRHRAFACMATAGLVGLLGGGLFFTLTELQDGGVEAAAPAVASVAAVPDPALKPADGLAESGEGPSGSVALVEGVLDVTVASLHEGTDGQAAPPSVTFPAGRQVSLWLEFEYAGRSTEDRLGAVWYRDGQEIGRSDFGLTTGEQRTSIVAPALPEAGPHRVDLVLNTEVIASVPFDVTAP
jgi:hypothetical protein